MLNRVCSVFVKLTVVTMLVVTVGATGCSSGGTSGTTGGTTGTTGGTTSFAGATGTTGGSISTIGITGGGGLIATGGATFIGGVSGTGGVTATGGTQIVTGGTTESGGVARTGGSPTAGGTGGGGDATGGANTSGRTSSIGGMATGGVGGPGTGGITTTGGNRATGGSASTGGVLATGGVKGGATSNRDAGADTPDAAIVDAGAPDSPADAGPGDGGTAFSCGSNTSPPPSVAVGGVTYNLNWSDEFNAATLDTTHWNSAATWCCGQGTNLPQNAYLNGGCLELKAGQSTGGGYTSGWVDTQGKYTFTRGYVEIRARLPKGQGMWPALWMDEVSGNPAAEFDIMEMLGNDPTTIYQTNHLWPSGGGAGTQVHQCTFKGPDFSAGFHVFGFQIQATQITWYVDGAQTCTTNQGVNTNPVYLMLNTAVGGVGSWPGAPDQSTVFPNYLDVDYVRVYQ
ncbi:MAG: glycoside hydrolase family 16 protein [Polyangia bacterium]